MRIAAIVAEFDPFHNGHQYLVNQAREKYHADHVIVIMSGSFVQRGMPAALPPYLRTQMALSEGVDLVLQLPVYGSLGSAEIFAASAVSIIDSIGIADMLLFGCEDDDPALMQAAAMILTDEPEDFKTHLTQYLRSGLTFPAARSRALAETMGNEAVAGLLAKPNNILAIEYLKALVKTGSSMIPCPVKRIGDDYHEQSLTGRGPASATAIRKACLSMEPEEIRTLSGLPPVCAELIAEYMKVSGMLTLQDFSEMIAFSLTANADHLSDYCDMTDDLARRCLTSLPSYEHIDQFIDVLHTKNVTESRVRRALCGLLLNHRKSLMSLWQARKFTGYVNVLGLRHSISAVLGEIPAPVRKTMIIRPRDLGGLDRTGRALAEADAFADSLYDRMCMIRYGYKKPDPIWKTIVMK